MKGEFEMKKIKILSLILSASFLFSACSSKAAVNRSVESFKETTIEQPATISKVSDKNFENNGVQSKVEVNKPVEKKVASNTTKAPSSSKTTTTTSTPKTQTSTPKQPPASAAETSKPSPTQTIPLAPSDLKTSITYLEYSRNSEHTTPALKNELYSTWLKKYLGYYVYNTNQKVIYLTFDEGYENGFTPSILDTLKKHNIKASFFCTKPFLTKNPSLVKRMVSEGHLVLNHSVTHPSFATLTEQQIHDELKGVEDAYKSITGKDMLKYVRPPKGEFSEKSLWVTNQLSYKSIFWSMAYLDWDTKKQPTNEQALSFIENSHHNGAILLLHAVSKTNADNLDSMLKILEDAGYRFGLISEL